MSQIKTFEINQSERLLFLLQLPIKVSIPIKLSKDIFLKSIEENNRLKEDPEANGTHIQLNPKQLEKETPTKLVFNFFSNHRTCHKLEMTSDPDTPNRTHIKYKIDSLSPVTIWMFYILNFVCLYFLPSLLQSSLSLILIALLSGVWMLIFWFFAVHIPSALEGFLRIYIDLSD